MKTYIPKQPKQTRERVEAKLDVRLVRELEKYCEYLESDRDYVLGQMLQVLFRKDKGFAAWRAAKRETPTAPVVTSNAKQVREHSRVGGTD